MDELEEDEDDPVDELEELELEDDDELELEEELDEEELEEEEDELELDELLELELEELPELEDEPVGIVGVSLQPARKAPAAIDAAPDNSSRNSRRSGVSSLTVGGNVLSAMI